MPLYSLDLAINSTKVSDNAKYIVIMLIVVVVYWLS